MQANAQSLPKHGWIGCARCYVSGVSPRLIGTDSPPPWKIETPNGSWGSSDPLLIVLGFSRGTRQSQPVPFDEIAFRGMREQLTKILRALHLLGNDDHVSNHIVPSEKNFHFASLLRCSISMWDSKKEQYSKSGNSILERFLADHDTCQVAENCVQQFLCKLSTRTKLIMMLGNSSDYIEGCKRLFKTFHPGIKEFNSVSYTNGRITWIHTIHAAAQGSYVPQWLAGGNSSIGRKFRPAQDAVVHSGVLPLLSAS